MQGQPDLRWKYFNWSGTHKHSQTRWNHGYALLLHGSSAELWLVFRGGTWELFPVTFEFAKVLGPDFDEMRSMAEVVYQLTQEK